METVVSFHHLVCLDLDGYIHKHSIPSLKGLLSHPTLEMITLTNHGFDEDDLHSLLRMAAQCVTTSPLRHLSLSPIETWVSSHLLGDDVSTLLATGRKGGLEYLDLRGLVAFQTLADFTRMVDEIERSNGTILGTKLDPPPFHLGAFGAVAKIQARLKAALERNRRRRSKTHRTALFFGPILRVILHRPRPTPFHFAGFESALDLNVTAPAPFDELPMEILLEIVTHLGTDPLTARQLNELIQFTADRRTLEGTKAAGDAKVFLHRVDCWKWDGVVGEEEEQA